MTNSERSLLEKHWSRMEPGQRQRYVGPVCGKLVSVYLWASVPFLIGWVFILGGIEAVREALS